MTALRLRARATLCLATLALAAPGRAAPPPLRIGMVPDAGATQVSVEQKAPLQAYLTRRLGRPVQLVIPTNYNATVEGIGNGSLDIAYFGGLTYVKAHARYGAVPLVQRDIDQRFHSLLITRPGSGITRLADLKGKSFCFGDINSTSGHLAPAMIFRERGLDPKRDFASARYTGSHPATAQAVASGACDAGAIDETVWKSLHDEGKLAPAAASVFYISKPFADYVWAARKDLDPRTRQAFTQALMALKTGRDDQVLGILRGTKYVPANDARYGGIARIARLLGLL